MASKYLPGEFEKKMIDQWEKDGLYTTPDSATKKVYTLSMFPYPSGAGLHVGHVRIYTGTDILARFFRMKGYSVLHPMGWDAFGLPAENAAIKAKKNPLDMVPDNIANFKKQMQSLGLSYDWSREFATTDPEYYRWTQWLFLQLYSIKNEKGERLVYRKEAPIKWCPFCKTGLANEEVLPDGTHERCGNMTVEKLLPQWMMRITDYADRLLSDLEGLDWPKGILEMQKNWIGKKNGAIIPHTVDGVDGTLDTFTAYPAWSFADTYIVVAPEHPFVANAKSDEVQKYLEEVKKETQEDRMSTDKEKTGVFTGFYAEDPFRKGEKMPIWIANFALMDFGTGAIRCSAHDPRDVAFAKKYNISIRSVVASKDGEYVNAHDNVGILTDSGPFTGREVSEVVDEFVTWMQKENIGKKHSTYHLRDWIFSRQRYWGEPFPLVYCDTCGDENGVVPLLESELPLTLPYVQSYEPTETGESPLSQIDEWVNVKCPKCGGPAKRETDTMPNWAGSCWYFLYFARQGNQAGPASSFPQSSINAAVGGPPDSSPANQMQDNTPPVIPSELHPPAGGESRDLKNEVNIENWKLKIDNSGKKFLPVDWYLGGAEHAVLHLLYARFWMKAFKDLGLVDFVEPFMKLRNVGMVLASDNRKMSKSLGNVVNPDDVISEYGADTVRVYEAFMAPFSQEVAWSTRAVGGAYRFLSRIWQIYASSDSITDDSQIEDKQLVAKLQIVISKITSDITDVKYNTSIAAMMEFINNWESSAGPVSPSSHKMLAEAAPLVGPPPGSPPPSKKLTTKNAQKFLQLLAPFAPFITDELWHKVFGEKGSIHNSSWPMVDESVIKTTTAKIAIQVNGKVRDVIEMAFEITEDEALEQALKSEKITKWVTTKPKKVIFVKGKILNIVTQP